MILFVDDQFILASSVALNMSHKCCLKVWLHKLEWFKSSGWTFSGGGESSFPDLIGLKGLSAHIQIYPFVDPYSNIVVSSNHIEACEVDRNCLPSKLRQDRLTDVWNCRKSLNFDIKSWSLEACVYLCLTIFHSLRATNMLQFFEHRSEAMRMPTFTTIWSKHCEKKLFEIWSWQ